VKALATDAHLREVVAGIRGLGRGGVPVVALASRPSAAGLWSRYVVSRRLAGDSTVHSAALDGVIAGIGRDHGPLVVYPGAEETINALVETVRPSPRVLLPYASLEAVRLLRDKRALAELAREAGLTAPATIAEGHAGDLARASIGVPCALKPVRSGSALATTRVVRSAPELRRVLGKLPATEPVLAQELYRGTLMAIALVIDGAGRPLARFQQASRRIWPREAGVSSLAVSVAPDERLVKKAVAVLRGASYAGMAQLQFIDGARGPLLIDVNPRFYGSLPLALASGVNLPAIWHAAVVDGSRPDTRDYRVGVTYRWLRADVAAAMGGAPGALLRRASRPRTGAVWAADDPLPALVSTAGTAALAARRRLPGRRRPPT